MKSFNNPAYLSVSIEVEKLKGEDPDPKTIMLEINYTREIKPKNKRSREETFEHLPLTKTTEINPPEVDANPDAYSAYGCYDRKNEHVELAACSAHARRKFLDAGMKNWMFIGHKNAGDRAAIMYTIIENCKCFIRG